MSSVAFLLLNYKELSSLSSVKDPNAKSNVVLPPSTCPGEVEGLYLTK